jgi:hypothetical protein
MSDDDAKARHTDPETSHIAAESLNPPTIARMERKVLWGVGRDPDNGLNRLDLWTLLAGQVSRQSISPRLCKLREKGLIEYRYTIVGKEITRPGETGRPQGVHFITPAGQALLKVTDEKK